MERHETTVLRLVDGDEHSLARRVKRVLESLPAGTVVGRFTYWYTGRPPLHEATVLPPPVEDGRPQ